MTQNCISSETHNWYIYQTPEIETQNLGFKQMASQGGVGGPNILLILATTCFLLNTLRSVCRYIMGPFSGWPSLVWEGQTAPFEKYVRNRWSPIHISNRFTSKLHILHKSDNIVHWVFAYRRGDKPDDVELYENLRKICRIIWCRFKISLKLVPKSPINNSPALVKIIAWRQTLSEPVSA